MIIYFLYQHDGRKMFFIKLYSNIFYEKRQFLVSYRKSFLLSHKSEMIKIINNSSQTNFLNKTKESMTKNV